MVTVDAGGTVRPSRRIGRPLGLMAEVTSPDVPPVVNTAVSPEPVADLRTATATTLSPAEVTLDDLDPATYVISDLTSYATSAIVPAAPSATVPTAPPATVDTMVATTVAEPEAPAGDYDRHWLAQRTSTPEDRHAFRGSLGWRYDAAVRSVARLMAEQPGLRGGGETDEASMTDLAAVRVFATGDHAEFVTSIRAGGGQDDRPFAACLAGGLRMLPALQGVVVRGGPPDPAAADAYRPGQELVEAAPLIALDAVDAQVPGAIEVLIWSATARRLSGFAEMDVSQVAFLPGTVFRVLAVFPAEETSAPVRRVLLAEVSPGRTRPEWAERVLARLEEAAAARAALGPAADDPTGRFAALPGDPVRARVAPIEQRITR